MKGCLFRCCCFIFSQILPLHIYSLESVYIANANTVTDQISVILLRDNTSYMLPIAGGGGGFSDIAVTPDGVFYYVVNIEDDKVWMLRASNNQVVGGPILIEDESILYGTIGAESDFITDLSNQLSLPLGTGAAPFGIAITPDGKYLYVTNIGADSVSVIRTRDNTVSKLIKVGKRPTGLVISPDGAYVYVINEFDNTVSVIQTTDNSVLDTKTTGGTGSNEVAITPDGKFLFVTNYSSANVSKIDTSNYDIEKIEGFGFPTNVAITQDGRYAYVLDRHNKVYRMHTQTNAKIQVPDPNAVLVGPVGIAITPDGAYAYISNNNGYAGKTVSVVRTNDNKIIGDPIKVGLGPFGVAVSPMFGPFTYSMEYEEAISGTYHYAQINWEIEGVSYKLYRNGILRGEFGADTQSYRDFEVDPKKSYIYTLDVTQNNDATGSTYGATFVEKYTAKKL